jgi:hypothetical protein
VSTRWDIAEATTANLTCWNWGCTTYLTKRSALLDEQATRPPFSRGRRQTAASRGVGLAGKERAVGPLGQGRPLKAGVSRGCRNGIFGATGQRNQAPCKAGSDAPKNGLLHAALAYCKAPHHVFFSSAVRVLPRFPRMAFQRQRLRLSPTEAKPKPSDEIGCLL